MGSAVPLLKASLRKVVTRMDKLRMMMLLGVNPFAFNSAVLHARAPARQEPVEEDTPSGDDAGEPLGVIELEETLSDVEKPKEIAAGLYEAEIQDVQVKTSGKGNSYFAIKCVIPDSALAPDVAENYPDGCALYYNRQLVPKKGDRRALFNLRKLIEAMGLDSNVSEIDPNEWMGRKVRVQIRMGKWQGEDRAEIARLEAAEAAPARRAAAAGRGRR